MDYEVDRWEAGDLVKLDILLNGSTVDALSTICHRSNSTIKAKGSRRNSRNPSRQMYEVAIQAAIGSKIIARSTVKALRKDVTAKCYGGDISRKRKLPENRKRAKANEGGGFREIPQEAFLSVLKVGE